MPSGTKLKTINRTLCNSSRICRKCNQSRWRHMICTSLLSSNSAGKLTKLRWPMTSLGLLWPNAPGLLTNSSITSSSIIQPYRVQSRAESTPSTLQRSSNSRMPVTKRACFWRPMTTFGTIILKNWQSRSFWALNSPRFIGMKIKKQVKFPTWNSFLERNMARIRPSSETTKWTLKFAISKMSKRFASLELSRTTTTSTHKSNSWISTKPSFAKWDAISTKMNLET